MDESEPNSPQHSLLRVEALHLAHLLGHSRPIQLNLDYESIKISVLADILALVLRFSLADEAGPFAVLHFFTLLRRKRTRSWALRVWWRAMRLFIVGLWHAVGGRSGSGQPLSWFRRLICGLALVTLPLHLVSLALMATAVDRLFEGAGAPRVFATRWASLVCHTLLLPLVLSVRFLYIASTVVLGQYPRRLTVGFQDISAHESLEILAAG